MMRCGSWVTRVVRVAPTMLVALGCWRSRSSIGDAAGQPVVTVNTAIATQRIFVETTGALGTIEPQPGHSAMLSAPMDGRITRVLVALGAHVQRSQPLVEFDPSTAIANAAGADAALHAAEAARARLERLVDQGVAARKDLEQAEAELAKAKADAVAAHRVVDLSVVRAPLDGVVIAMRASLGTTALVGDPLVEIADPKALDLVLAIPPSEADRVRPGQTVVLSSATDARDTIGVGTVAAVAGALDLSTHTVAVRVRIDRAGRVLRVGETVTGAIVTARKPNAVTVPVAALVPDGDGFKVFVADSGDVVHSHRVTIGGRANGLVEISSGLAVGDRVVTTGAFGLDVGVKIVTDSTHRSEMPPGATPDSGS